MTTNHEPTGGLEGFVRVVQPAELNAGVSLFPSPPTSAVQRADPFDLGGKHGNMPDPQSTPNGPLP